MLYRAKFVTIIPLFGLIISISLQKPEKTVQFMQFNHNITFVSQFHALLPSNLYIFGDICHEFLW